MKKEIPPKLSTLRKIAYRIFNTPELFFLVVSILFGFLFILITPPLQGPDEQSHFTQAYKVSEFDFISNPNDTTPTSLRTTLDALFYNDDIRFNGNNKYEMGRTKQALQIPIESNNREKMGYVTGTTYAPTNYSFQAFMILLGRIFRMPPVVLIYLARVGNLAAWLLLIFLAIKYSPIGKWPIAVISIVPMSVFQSAVVSADSISTGLATLFVAFTLSLYARKKPIVLKDFIILILIGCLLALSKQILIIFLPLVFLLLFKKKNRVSEKRKKNIQILLLTLALILPIAISLVWSIVSSNLNPSTILPNGVMPVQQIKNIIIHPTEFIFALWNTGMYTWSDGITRSVIGTFGWSDTPMALVFTILGYFTLLVVMLANRGNDYMTAKSLTRPIPRIITSTVGVTYILAVCAALYIYYTPLNFNIIVGLQGRYFLPLLLIPIVLFINNDSMVIKEKLYNTLVKFMPILLLMVSGLYIYLRYYTNTTI